MIEGLKGLDHVVYTVDDLEAAAARWRALGFTLTPRGLHSGPLGTANHTIMLGEDYIELIGVLQATELNAPARAFLQRRGPGIDRVAFTTTDAAAGAAAIRERGLDPKGPISFGRPVDLPGGKKSEAKFEVFHWPFEERPADVRIFACQHLTRDAVWVPEWQHHANGATGIVRIELLTPRPSQAAAKLAELIDTHVRQTQDALVIDTAAGRGSFEFLERADFVKRHPNVDVDALPEEGAAALVLRTSSVQDAARVVGAAGRVEEGGAVEVQPSKASGVLLRFEGPAQ